MNALKRFELIELNVPASSQGRVTFQTIPQLRNQANQSIIIQAIEVFTSETYSNSQQNPGIANLPVAELKKAVLVLYVNGEESVKMIPLSMLVNIETGTAGSPAREIPVEFDDLTNVDFDKSYVQFSTATTATDYIIPLGVSYLRFTKPV